MTFAEAAMIMMSGGSANIQPLTVTQNGQYNAPEGVSGYNPVMVNVPVSKPVIRSLTVTRNGRYDAADYGYNGFDPVIVNNPYEILWKQEHGQTEEIDTGLTDEEDKPIIIDGLPVDDIDDVINSGFDPDQPVDITFAALSDSGMIYVHLQYKKTIITPDWETQYYISETVTNAQTGESKTVDRTVTAHGSHKPVVTLDTAYNINYHITIYSSGYPFGAECMIYPSDVGVTGAFKYYICKSPDTE